jgi:hypothetical protein
MSSLAIVKIVEATGRVAAIDQEAASNHYNLGPEKNSKHIASYEEPELRPAVETVAVLLHPLELDSVLEGAL